MSLPYIVCALVTAISALVSFGFSAAAALAEIDQAKTMAFYACARSVALVLVSVVPLLTGSSEWLQAVAWAMIVVQAGDSFIGTTIQDRIKTFGPAGAAVANLLALLWLIQSLP